MLRPKIYQLHAADRSIDSHQQSLIPCTCRSFEPVFAPNLQKVRRIFGKRNLIIRLEAHAQLFLELDRQLFGFFLCFALTHARQRCKCLVMADLFPGLGSSHCDRNLI